MFDLPPLATPDEVAKYLAVPAETLKYWRYMRKGPRYVKVEKHVRYRRADVERYLDANTRHTS